MLLQEGPILPLDTATPFECNNDRRLATTLKLRKHTDYYNIMFLVENSNNAFVNFYSFLTVI